jgi:diacylglycerol kinase
LLKKARIHEIPVRPIMKKDKFGRSLMNASRGIAHALSRERNITIQVVIGIIVMILSLLLGVSKAGLMFIIIACFFVIIMELVNTAIEHLIDKINPDYDKDYGRIKDMMAGAVLLATILAVIIGILVLASPIVLFVERII